MDISVGDILVMKKNHPCGSNRFLVLRVGMDFKLRCQGGGREFLVLRSGMDFRIRCTTCGREMMLTRQKAEKAARKVEKKPEE